MTSVAAIGIAAGVLQGCAYIVYILQMVRAECRPNGMSWVMWAYGTAVLLVIEVRLGAPLSVLVLPAICLACSITIAVHAYWRGVALAPTRLDWGVLGLDVMLTVAYVALVLKEAHPAETAALGLVFVALTGATSLTSTWPILCSTWREPSHERPLAWFIWSAAYGMLALAVMLEGLSWHYLVYPTLCQALHVVIGVFAMEAIDTKVQADDLR